MNHIYLPESISNQCAYIYDKDTIRVYETRPTNNSLVSFKDYYINSNYIYRSGSTQFSQYTTLPSCLSSDIFTTEVYYRNDFDKIMIITMILIILLIYFPYKIVSRAFGRWLKI